MKAHISMAPNTGLTRELLAELASVLSVEVGEQESGRVETALEEIQ